MAPVVLVVSFVKQMMQAMEINNIILGLMVQLIKWSSIPNQKFEFIIVYTVVDTNYPCIKRLLSMSVLGFQTSTRCTIWVNNNNNNMPFSSFDIYFIIMILLYSFECLFVFCFFIRLCTVFLSQFALRDQKYRLPK